MFSSIEMMLDEKKDTRTNVRERTICRRHQSPPQSTESAAVAALCAGGVDTVARVSRSSQYTGAVYSHTFSLNLRLCRGKYVLFIGGER